MGRRIAASYERCALRLSMAHDSAAHQAPSWASVQELRAGGCPSACWGACSIEMTVQEADRWERLSEQ